MFIYFHALPPACYVHSTYKQEGISDVILSATPQILHLNAYFCSILLITVKKKPHNIDIRGEIHSQKIDPKITLTCTNTPSD